MIFTFTDFGINGPYLGQMKASIYKRVPDITICDLMVDVPQFDIEAASLLLRQMLRDLPNKSIVLCVVDPGVGGDRKPLFIETDHHIFVGPDNGLFRGVLELNPNAKAYEILWRPERLSKSFHGRDLFAPICAKLKLGETFDKRPINVNHLTTIKATEIIKPIYVDHYGNIWTNLLTEHLQPTDQLIFNNIVISYADVFCDTEVGNLFWYYNSSGFVEIAANQKSAKEILKIDQNCQIVKRSVDE